MPSSEEAGYSVNGPRNLRNHINDVVAAHLRDAQGLAVLKGGRVMVAWLAWLANQPHNVQLEAYRDGERLLDAWRNGEPPEQSGGGFRDARVKGLDRVHTKSKRPKRKDHATAPNGRPT